MGIGIVEKYDSEACQMIGDKNCSFGYGFWNSGLLCLCKCGGEFERLPRPRDLRWNNKNMKGENRLKVMVDCVKWKMSFEINGKTDERSYPIEERDTYYPTLNICQCGEYSIHVVDC